MKKILLLIAFVGIFASCTKEPGTVSGVVTYFFNDHQGFKPDIGATVYFTQSNCDTLELALRAIAAERSIALSENSLSSLKSLIAIYLDSATASYYSKTEREEAQQKADKYSSELPDREKALANATQDWLDIVKDSTNAETIGSDGYKALLNIKLADDTFDTVIDGSGNYSILLPPGKYTMIVVSKGRTRTNILEISGRVTTRAIEVKSKETINESFEVNM